MNRICILLVLSTAALHSHGQNLVSNPDFETYTSIPTNVGQCDLSTGWNDCNGGGSPDYFHTLATGMVNLPNCFIGTVNPNSGGACMGAALYYYSPPDYREYISSQLISPLVIGQTYNVSFFITNGVTGGFYGGGGIDKISAAFTTVPLTQTGTGPIPVVPQTTHTAIYYSTTWQQISMQFVADSAYQFITLGNFFQDASTAYQQFDSCQSFGAYYFFDDIVVELANTAPIAVFSAPNNICPGTCTDFINLSVNATSFLWNFAGANPAVSTDANPVSICYNTPGNYSVQLIAYNSVTSDTLTLMNYITVYPYPAPQGIIQSGDTLLANSGAVSYQWYYNGNLISGATDAIYIAQQSGNYNVVATDANGCEVEAAIFDVIAAVTNIDNSKPILISPNPAKDLIELLTDVTPEELVVYDVLGKKENVRIHRDHRRIDIGNLPPGIYWLQMSTSDSYHWIKFVRE